MTIHILVVDLATPVASSDPYIHLDSFLSYAAGVESIGHDGLRNLEDGGEPRYFKDEMPLEKIEHNGDWVWAATAAMVAEPEEYRDESGTWNTTKWRKRFDVDLDHQIKRTNINTSSGEFKSYNADLPYNAADKLLFYFRGDAERTKEMVEAHVSGIGKKRSQGFGMINEVHVAEADESVESVLHHKGKVLRSIPSDWLTRVEPGVLHQQRTTKPPYWHPENQCMAVPPFEEVSARAVEPIQAVEA